MASAINKKFYNTNIIDSSIKVFSLSDIHGNIQSLIISLQDYAKVIRKKKKISFLKKAINKADDLILNLTPKKADDLILNLTPKKADEDIETMLKKDLNDLINNYTDDLNYEWCGGNTHVVICGDMIDSYKLCLKEDSLACSYYPQIELKILMFINALNIQASKFGGKIVKLFGNHELMNIISEPNNIYNTSPYYRGTSRTDIFRVGNYGFELLVEGGCCIFVKINNTIFVHGYLIESYDIYDDLNQFINNPDERTQEKWNQKFNIYIRKDISSLFNENQCIDTEASYRINIDASQTKFDLDSERTTRLLTLLKDAPQGKVGNNTSQISCCDNLIESFKEEEKVIIDDVIDNCPQHSEIREDDIMDVFGHDYVIINY